MKINITVILKAKDERLQEIKNVLINLAENSKKEKACIQYDLHQHAENHNVFILHEIWENQEGLALHESLEHFLEFKAKASELLAAPIEVYKTNRIV